MSWGLVLRALWWRRGLTAAVLLVATATTAAAALGPLYARAAGESILQDHLSQAGSNAGLHLHTVIDSAADYNQAAAGAPKPGSVRGYDQQIQSLFTPLSVGALATGSKSAVITKMLWRSGFCQHVVLVSGRCPSGPSEAMASQTDRHRPVLRVATRHQSGPDPDPAETIPSTALTGSSDHRRRLPSG